MLVPDASILACALLLDLALGDPRWLPHPVVLIGRLISLLEKGLRKAVQHERTAGILLLIFTVSIAMTVTWLLLRCTSYLHPLAGILSAIFICSTCLAARSLHTESALVVTALRAGDIDTARKNLAYIVGRDTTGLEENEIWRALIETVAENTADGVVSPLFWLTIGGPVAGIGFKAISTLDSMVGYKNPRYLHFGWASARIDDLANYLPARLTALLMIICSPLAGLSLSGAARITLRDRLNHPSPNSGHPEAAAAGSLGVRLGGAACYGGQTSWKEYIGDPAQPIDELAYRGMLRLMYITTFLMVTICIAVILSLRGDHVFQF
ncbi:MAG TPA: adenosylcobinamide-phosphate synthase CbiB [Desulfuromonadaceae bacterium]|jgi:adenosylcobinamide-phosphate synthase